MVEFSVIEEKIFKGLKDACKTAYGFSGEANLQIEPEYIVTVNIANALNEINEAHYLFGSPLKIVVEEDTMSFAPRCMPPFRWDDLFSSTMRSEGHNSDRNGRIDIAVYEVGNDMFDNDIPKCPIEVKRFGPSKGKVIADLLRNSEYLSLSDATGENRLQKTYVALLEQDEGCIFSSYIQVGLDTIKAKYQGYEEYLRAALSDTFVYRVEVKTVNEDLLGPDEPLKGLEDTHAADRIYESFHHVGVLLVIERL